MFDSGIRTGEDVFEPLALGAEAVLLGRPYCYGLAAGEKEGVRSVIRHYRADFDLTMGLAGWSGAARDLPGQATRWVRFLRPFVGSCWRHTKTPEPPGRRLQCWGQVPPCSRRSGGDCPEPANWLEVYYGGDGVAYNTQLVQNKYEYNYTGLDYDAGAVRTGRAPGR